MSRNHKLFKVLMVGDANVGKTALVTKFAFTGRTDEEFVSTIGVDFKTRDLVVSGNKLRLQIWDTAGQTKRHRITTSYYRGARGIFIVYDVTSEESYEGVREWIADVKNNVDKSVALMIIGNNGHFQNNERQVTWERGKQLADEVGLKFMEVSTETGQNIEEALASLCRGMLATEPNVIISTKETSRPGKQCSLQ